MRRPYQGQLDQLCGVYCLTLALGGYDGSRLVGRTPTARYKNAFAKLMASMEDQELLTAENLSNKGLTDSELIKIFNGVDQKYRNGLIAVLSKEYVPGYDGSFASIGAIIDACGSAVISSENDRHWILAYKRQGSFFKCRDPYAYKQEIVRKRASSGDGVALIPRKLV